MAVMQAGEEALRRKVWGEEGRACKWLREGEVFEVGVRI